MAWCLLQKHSSLKWFSEPAHLGLPGVPSHGWIYSMPPHSSHCSQLPKGSSTLHISFACCRQTDLEAANLNPHRSWKVKTNEYRQSSEPGRGKGDECPLEEITVPDNHCSGIMSEQNEGSTPIYKDSIIFFINSCTHRRCHRLHSSKLITWVVWFWHTGTK